MNRGFAIVDASGAAVAIADTLAEAGRFAKKQVAKSKGRGEVLYDTDQCAPPDRVQANPPLKWSTLETSTTELWPSFTAYKKTGLGQRLHSQHPDLPAHYDNTGEPYYPIDTPTLLQMSAEEAWQTVRPYLPPSQSWQRSPAAAAAGFFVENSKTKKQINEFVDLEGRQMPFKAVCYALSLAPHQLGMRDVGAPSARGFQLHDLPPETDPHAHIFRGDYPLAPSVSHPTLCAFSSGACRATCLVHTGQNPLTDSPYRAKMALTAALLHEPLAFCRLLLDGARKTFRSAVATDAANTFFNRVNAYSDIPWEIFFPDLVLSDLAMQDDDGQLIGRGKWYDYTKTPFRFLHQNKYWLTFSFSGGGQAAIDLCQQALQYGQNVATVFVRRAGEDRFFTRGDKRNLRYAFGAGVDKKSKEITRLAKLSYGFRWLDAEVINGDLHDARPLDRYLFDMPVIVGLDFKLPSVRGPDGKQVALFKLGSESKFIVQVEEIDGQLVQVGGLSASQTQVPESTK